MRAFNRLYVNLVLWAWKTFSVRNTKGYVRAKHLCRVGGVCRTWPGSHRGDPWFTERLASFSPAKHGTNILTFESWRIAPVGRHTWMRLCGLQALLPSSSLPFSQPPWESGRGGGVCVPVWLKTETQRGCLSCLCVRCYQVGEPDLGWKYFLSRPAEV